MNYDEARELKDGGWHWTTMNDGVVRTAPPCVRIPIDESTITHCDPHPTREDAERHFYDYSLSQLKESTFLSAKHCEYCDTWTNKALGNRGLGLYFREVFLCDTHRTTERVAALHPFKPGIALIHS